MTEELMTPERLDKIMRRVMEWARSAEDVRYNAEGRKVVSRIITEDTAELVLEVRKAFKAYKTLEDIMNLPEVVADPLLTVAVAKVVHDGLTDD